MKLHGPGRKYVIALLLGLLSILIYPQLFPKLDASSRRVGTHVHHWILKMIRGCCAFGTLIHHLGIAQSSPVPPGWFDTIIIYYRNRREFIEIILGVFIGLAHCWFQVAGMDDQLAEADAEAEAEADAEAEAEADAEAEAEAEALEEGYEEVLGGSAQGSWLPKIQKLLGNRHVWSGEPAGHIDFEMFMIVWSCFWCLIHSHVNQGGDRGAQVGVEKWGGSGRGMARFQKWCANMAQAKSSLTNRHLWFFDNWFERWGS